MSEQTNTVVEPEQTEAQHRTDVTPYMAAKIATQVLRKAGKLTGDQEIAPQTMYSNKSIKRYGSPKTDGGTGVYFDGDSFAAWLEAQKKGVATGARGRVDVDALAREYMQDFEGSADTEDGESEIEGDEDTDDADQLAEEAERQGRHGKPEDNEDAE